MGSAFLAQRLVVRHVSTNRSKANPLWMYCTLSGTVSLGYGSIYTLLTRTYGQRPTSAAESLEPVIARPDEADLLKVDEGSPLMLITRTAFTTAGLAVEFARDLFRPDRIKVSLQTGI